MQRFRRIASHDSVGASEAAMRPKKYRTAGSDDLFRARLDQIINMKHSPDCDENLDPARPGSQPRLSPAPRPVLCAISTSSAGK